MEKEVSAEKPVDRERGFADGSRPTRQAVWERIDEEIADILRIFGSDTSRASTASDSKLAAQLFERLQAFYLLLRRFDYEAFALREQFAVVDSLLTPYLLLSPRRYGDLSYFHDEEHSRDVHKLAAQIQEQIKKETLQSPTLATRELDDNEKDELLKAFTQVSYAPGRVVYLEDDFAKQMLEDWDKPMLTTTAHAVETLHAIARRRESLLRYTISDALLPGPGFSVSPDVLAFVSGCYDTDHFRDPRDDQELYATSSGISVFKAHANLSSNQRISGDQLQRLFLDTGIDAVAIRKWTQRKLGELLGLNATKSNLGSTKVIELNHAVRILWNLSGDLELRILLENFKPKLREFLRSCMRPGRIVSGKRYSASFSMSPDTTAVCLTACLAALRIVRYAEIVDPELEAHLNACKDYIWGCHSEGSGFGSSIGHTPDLLHTYMAIAMIQTLDWEPPSQGQQQGFVKFMGLCFKDGGYAMLPELLPSAYGTRLAVQIMQRLRLPLHRLPEMSEFIERLLERNHKHGAGYRGYIASSAD